MQTDKYNFGNEWETLWFVPRSTTPLLQDLKQKKIDQSSDLLYLKSAFASSIEIQSLTEVPFSPSSAMDKGSPP